MKKNSNLSRLLFYAGNHKYLTYASWILSALSALIGLIPYWYLWKVVKDIMDSAPNFENAVNAVHYGWMAVLFAVIALLVYISALMCSHLGAFRIASNMRISLMRHIISLPMGLSENFGSGRLRKIVNESTAATETYLAHQLPDRASAIATPCGLLLLLFIFDWRLGILSLVPVILGFLIMLSMTGPQMQQKMREYQNALEDMSNEAVEYVRGMPVVKTFGQTIFTFKKFKASIDHYHKWVVAYTKQLRTPMMFYTAAINAVFAFLIAGALFMTSDGVTDEFLIDLIFYIIITPVISITLTRIMFQSENAMIVDDSLSRMDTILRLSPLKEAEKPLSPADGSVELDNVSFSYDGKNDVLKNICLKVPSGSKVALVGPSGGGKSTLANIISRFYDPREGAVKIGGVDVKNIKKEELMNTVSFVFQNNQLIKASILDNVRMGRPFASRSEVIDALKCAQCQDIIEKLPKGIDTVIGTKGIYLSGGEQQRIAIARAILKNSPIVIMDEATAFADPDNEARIQTAFTNMSNGKTVIMIAHRLSTVAGADKIYVIKDGEIAESGTKDELLAKGGMFAGMWKNYQASVQWKVSKEE